jgi:hypothetical protein
MTVFNRSNDMIWGTFGANAVHMSMLQEFIASACQIQVGSYYQISNNFHAYVSTFEKHKNVMFEGNDPYETEEIVPFPMMSTDANIWLQDLSIFMDQGPIVGFREPFFRKVATPIYMAWKSWKSDDVKSKQVRADRSIEILEQCQAADWKKACQEWLLRRIS